LTPENRTLYALLPSGTAPKTSTETEISQEHPVQKFDLPNGLRLLLKEDHRLPFVEFRAVFKGGVLAETAEKNGVTQLMGKLLLKGTKKRSAEEIASEIEAVGGNIESYGGYNSFGVSAEVMAEDFATGLDLLADVLLNPDFPSAAIERERDVQLAGIRAQKDQLLQSASRAMRRGLFGEIGYGLDALGTETSVPEIQAADLRDFHDRFTRPNNCVIAIFGDVDAAKVQAEVARAFAKWAAKKDAALNSNPNLPGLNAPQRITELRDKKQAVLIVGFRGTTLHAPDRYALELLQEACSDLGSRLFLRIREKMGLAYYVGAQNFVGLAPGYFAFYVGTAPEKVDLVEKEILSEAELLRIEGLTPEELKRAKAKVIGQRKIARQDLGGLALATALDELYGLGYAHSEAEDAFFEAVTLDEIKRAAQKYLQPDALVIAVVRPGEKADSGETASDGTQEITPTA